MPTTVNGIGSRYFGKRNRRQFDGVCQFCQRASKLENYETRLVFSVFFIPIIPLGKKQILNYCPRCTRHGAIAYSAWQQAKAEAVETSAAELARSSNDPDAAIRMHATYEAYQMQEEAARFADALATLHGDVARVQFYLGGCWERAGLNEQANNAFFRALQIEPANLQYQRAAAISHIRAGQLDQAARLLEAFRPPSPAFEPALFLILASAYQERQRHEEAMTLYTMLVAAQPELRKQRSFRNTVRTSERALGAAESIVGREPFYRRRSVQLTAAAALVLALWSGADYYARHHRRLFVVNGLKVPLAVKLDGDEPLTLAPNGRTEVPVSEGHHRAEVVQPALNLPPTEFDVSSHWLIGMFRSPAFVIDPSRSAAVVYEEVSYAVPGEACPPGSNEWHVGEAFMSFPDIDYPFGSFPPQIAVKRGRPERKSRIDLLTFAPEQAVALTTVVPGLADKTLPLAEAHLRATPDEQMLLLVYWSTAVRQGQAGRCSEFLETRLTDRPVRVEWHRAWQGLRQDAGDDDQEIIKRYDTWLAAEPRDSSLLYLRGRCDPDSEIALGYYQRSQEADAASAYPRFAQAVVWAGRGELRRAREAAGEAVRLKPNDVFMRRTLNQLRFALGEYADLEGELRASVSATPFAADEQEQLVAVLVAAGKTEEAKQHINTFVGKTGGQFPQQAEALIRQMRNAVHYQQGKFDEIVAATAPPLDPTEVGAQRYHAQFELGQVIEPPAGLQVLDEMEDAYALLCQALAWSERGDAAAAAAARQKAIEQLRQGRRQDRDAADVLAKGEAWTPRDLDRLSHDPRLRTISLVALAESCPTPPQALLDLAEKVNYDSRFPHHFLRRTIDRLRHDTTAAIEP